MHNFVLALIMGVLFGPALKTGQIIVCIQLFGRTLILPFLFNAILLMNAELLDPFDGGHSAFPPDAYETALEKDCLVYVQATDLAPQWIQDALVECGERAKAESAGGVRGEGESRK